MKTLPITLAQWFAPWLALWIGMAGCCLAAPPAPAPGETTAAAPLDDAELERSGAVIGAIEIDTGNVFDPSVSGENRPAYRVANFLHIKTRRQVIADQLLFKTGDRFSRRLLEESERILRANPYLAGATIKVASYHDSKLDIVVTTQDAWSFYPGAIFGRSGGVNTSGVNLNEQNLLGSGVSLGLFAQRDVDRHSKGINVSDAHALGTWTSMQLNYSRNSDGLARGFNVDHPFYALDVRRAAGLAASDATQTDSVYDRGQIVDQFQDHGRFAELYGGWSPGLRHGWVDRWRLGATYDEHRFEVAPGWTGVSLVPANRKFVYPWAQFDLVQDAFVVERNYDQIERSEDLYVGTSASARIGWADPAFGSNQRALLFDTRALHGLAPTAQSTLIASSDFNGRVQDGELYNGILTANLRYYARESKRWLFFSRLQAAAGHRLDLDNQLLLGGDNGLRGYPLRYQGGDGRALATLEQRYFGDFYPRRLFRVGAAAFVDVGRTWGAANLSSPSLGTLTDAGFGLRIGNNRSAFGNVIHIDLAFPLNGGTDIRRAQFLVQGESRF